MAFVFVKLNEEITSPAALESAVKKIEALRKRWGCENTKARLVSHIGSSETAGVAASGVVEDVSVPVLC